MTEAPITGPRPAGDGWEFLAAHADPSLHPRAPVSTRMLYEMAKRYDEWDGEDYEGSNIRGAMKGWHKHGVCAEELWPYVVGQEGGVLPPAAQSDAFSRPLGNFLRVRHHHLPQMHAALTEVGIVYASSQVHTGWNRVDPATGRIPFETELIGGHAFAIVGYDDFGLWIQNSWGSKWGLGGVCQISYDEWLENSMDCWVARMGVPTQFCAEERRDNHWLAAVH